MQENPEDGFQEKTEQSSYTIRISVQGGVPSNTKFVIKEDDPVKEAVFDFLSGKAINYESFGWPQWVQDDLLKKIKHGKRTTDGIINNFGDVKFTLKTLKVSQILSDNIDTIIRRVPECWFNLIISKYGISASYDSNLEKKEIANHKSRLKNALYSAVTTPQTMPPLIMRGSKLAEGFHRFIAISTLGFENVEAYIGRSNAAQRKALNEFLKEIHSKERKDIE